MAESVLVVTQHYRPEVIGSAPYMTDLAEWLAGRGRPVTVLTGLAHYPNAADFRSFNARAPRQNVVEGVAVERLRCWTPERRSALLRICSEFLFLLAGLVALLSGRISRHGVVISLCPSIFAVVLGIVATRRGGRHVAMVHDIQSGLAQGLNLVRLGIVIRMMRWCERTALNRLDAVFVLTDEMEAQLRQIGVTAPIEILPIWTDTDRIRPTELAGSNAPVLLYSGNFGRKQGLEQIIALAEALAPLRPDVTILLRGDGGERAELSRIVAERGLANIRLAGLLPKDRLNEGLAMGDIHLVPQLPSAADFAIPSKIYSIMAAGRPFLATANPGSSLWRLQEETGAFLCVPPEDPAQLCDAVMQLLADPERRSEMGRRGREYVETHHARQALLERFEKTLNLLTRGGGLRQHRRRVLVLEPDRDGHPREWLQHLLHHMAKQEEIERVWFVVAPELHEALAAQLPDDIRDRVQMMPLTETERRFCTHKSLPVSGFARWWVMRRYLRSTGAEAGYFLSLDHLSLPLACGLGAAGRKLGGILFRPSVHYRLLGSQRPTWKERLRDLRKAVLYRLMLLNGTLDSVLTLDPFFPDFAAERYSGGYKVRAVPDPAHPPVPAASDGGGLISAIPEGRVVLLLFGVLTERKGLLHLLEALRFLEPSIASRAAVVIAGKVAADLAESVAKTREHLRHEQPDLWLHVEDRWLESAEIAALVQRCDIVLAPYQRFVGSSGVLLWAAQASKPLLTQDYGLVGRLVQDYGLGFAADMTQPLQLTMAIEQMIVNGPHRFINRKSAQAFVSDRTPETFAAQVFGSLRAL